MLVTLPQGKALLYAALAAILTVVAVALVGVNVSRVSHDSGPAPVTSPGSDATPGSTAHARHTLRVSLGR